MKKSEFCVLIKHCFLMGKNTVQTKQWLNKCYGKSSSFTQVGKGWIGEIKGTEPKIGSEFEHSR